MKTHLLQAVFITSSLAKNRKIKIFMGLLYLLLLDFAKKLKLKEFTQRYISFSYMFDEKQGKLHT